MVSPFLLGQNGCPPDTELAGLIISTDYLKAMIRIMEPTTQKVVFDYDVRASNPEYCSSESSVLCSVMGFEHHYVEGENLLDLMVQFPDGNGEVFSIVERLKIRDPIEKIWSIDRLNYDGVPHGADYCPEEERENGTCCGIGSWGGQRLSMGDYVMEMGATTGASGAGGC